MVSRTTLRASLPAVLLTLALVVTGCSSSSDPGNWEDADETGKIEENFLRACSEGDDASSDPDELAAYCGCSYDALREEYADDFEGFLDVNRELGNDPTEIPSNIREIFEGCATAHLTS